jgi:DNA gyrase subunit B
VDKRLRDEKVTELLPRLDLSKHTDFEGDKKTPPKKIERLERELKKLQKERNFKSVESRFDEEHNLWELRFVSSQGAEHVINWELASSAEFKQLIVKFKQIEQHLEPPFIVEGLAKVAANAGNGDEPLDGEAAESDEQDADEKTKGAKSEAAKAEKKSAKAAAKPRAVLEPVEKSTARELFEYVKKEGSRGYDVQRYKGLGEMTAPQLWETTMDPERRTLLSVKLQDIAECETIFTTLMGEDVEARRKFIEENALDVKNLDI